MMSDNQIIELIHYCTEKVRKYYEDKVIYTVSRLSNSKIRIVFDNIMDITCSEDNWKEEFEKELKKFEEEKTC